MQCLKQPRFEAMRLDQWLWAVRIFKTRTQAAQAIRAGRVSIGGLPAKPARDVRTDDIIIVRVRHLTRTIRVLGEPPSRVGAKLVPKYMEDLTAREEYERRPEHNLIPPGFRQVGSGRPTKRERRELDQLADSEQ